MVIHGRVQNGVVIPDRASALPEGASVTITFPALPDPKATSQKQRIQVPLVRTGQPGTVQLSGAQIADILDQEDASPRR